MTIKRSIEKSSIKKQVRTNKENKNMENTNNELQYNVEVVTVGEKNYFKVTAFYSFENATATQNKKGTKFPILGELVDGKYLAVNHGQKEYRLYSTHLYEYEKPQEQPVKSVNTKTDTVNAINSAIKLLQEQQSGLKESSKRYKELQQKIDELTNKLMALF